MKLLIYLMLALSIITSTAETCADEAYKIDDSKIIMSKDERSYVCKLDTKLEFPLDNGVKSFDKTALIVSDRGYVEMSSLNNCTEKNPIHVFFTPQKVGYLVDINLNKKIYVSIDLMSVQPLLYLATVSHIGSAKNLINLSGAYVRGRNFSKLRDTAFISSGHPGSAIISPDGKFISPDGTMNCNDDSSPGVWNILKNSRVVADGTSCAKLFVP